MSDHEFIDREQQLPADPRAAGAVDMANVGQLTGQMERVKPGEPPIDFTVRSVYDSRPVQGQDFNITAIVTQIVQPGNNDCSFTVPQGYVAVVRRLHHFVTNPPVGVGINRSDALCSILLDNADYPYNKNIPVGWESDDIVNLFMIADEFQTVTTRFVFSAVVLETSALYVTFYGNLLLKTGRPAQFEIANPAARGAVIGPQLSLPLPTPAPASRAQSVAPIATAQPKTMSLLPPFDDAYVCDILRRAAALPFEQRAAFWNRQENMAFKSAWSALSVAQRDALAQHCGVYFSGPSAPRRPVISAR